MSSKLNLTIVIGTRRYSSWSLRGWLAVRLIAGKGNFEEIFTPIAGLHAQPEERERIRQHLLQYSPSGLVPVLIDHELSVTVNESLAIILHLAHKYPESKLLPSDPSARALCLSAAAEMHAGFTGLRSNWPHNCMISGRKHGAKTLAENKDLQRDIERLNRLWDELLVRFGDGTPNSYLFGSHPSVADIMFAPVANRFVTYDPDLTALSTQRCKDYIQALLKIDGMQEWRDAAAQEDASLIIPDYEKTSD